MARISVRPNDSGYDVRATQGYVKVYVNEIDVTNCCYTADEEEGKAWCYLRNEVGRVYVDPNDDEKIAEEILTGAVKIVIGTARVS